MTDLHPLLVAWLTGLLGGVHCVGMCGGIVAATALQGEQRPALLLGYNLGRVVSYVLAGALAGLIGSAALLSQHLLPVQQSLYLLAQGMLILLGLYLAGFNASVLWVERGGAVLWRRVQPWLARFVPVNTAGRAVAAGALWGWLPCGLVYSVLILALAQGSAGGGALLMLAFGLGTLPNLLAMGWMAQRLRVLKAQPWLRRVAGLVVIAMGVAGLWVWFLKP